MTATNPIDPLKLATILPGASRAHIVAIRLKRLLDEDIRRVLSEHSALTIPEWRILAVLNSSPTALAQKEVISQTKIAQGQASRVLFAMQERGLLEATQSTADRRAWHYRLSPEGRDQFARMIPHMQTRERALDGAVTAQDLAAFERVAQQIAALAIQRQGAPAVE